MRRAILLILLSVLTSACSRDSEPLLSVENVRVFAPLPGRSESVAYLDVHNAGDSAVSLVGISSSDFVKAQIHQTRIDNGIARMEMLGAAKIDADSRLSLAPGGLHIMLLEPRRALLPGAAVQIELRFDDGTVMLLDAPVQTRLGTQDQ